MTWIGRKQNKKKNGSQRLLINWERYKNVLESAVRCEFRSSSVGLLEPEELNISSTRQI